MTDTIGGIILKNWLQKAPKNKKLQIGIKSHYVAFKKIY